MITITLDATLMLLVFTLLFDLCVVKFKIQYMHLQYNPGGGGGGCCCEGGGGVGGGSESPLRNASASLWI